MQTSPWMRSPRQWQAAAARVLRGHPLLPPVFAGATLGAAEVAAARAALAEPLAGRPEDVQRFESAFASWQQARSATTFLGGRVALSAALAALRLRPGDEVILPGYTCVVVPNALRFAGVVPVFRDIELETFGLDAAQVRPAIGKRTKALLLQHLYGLPSRDADELRELARSRGLAVIEDCAQATGALAGGKPLGSQADIAIHSLEKTKVISTVAGGVATTNDPELAGRLAGVQASAAEPDDATVRRLLRNVVLYGHEANGSARQRAAARAAHGDVRWVSTTAEEAAGQRPDGYGRRWPAALAGIGMLQLARAEALNDRRRKRAGHWQDWATSHGLTPPTVAAGSRPVFLRYPLLVDPGRKADPTWARRELGVTPGLWFTGQLHPVKHELPQCPNAALAVERCINLPTLW